MNTKKQVILVLVGVVLLVGLTIWGVSLPKESSTEPTVSDEVTTESDTSVASDGAIASSGEVSEAETEDVAEAEETAMEKEAKRRLPRKTQKKPVRQ